MSIEIKVPSLGESVTEATVARWLKQPGETVKVDEPLVELETDKITLEVGAPTSGTLENILAQAGTNVVVGATLGNIKEGKSETAIKKDSPVSPAPSPSSGKAESLSKAELPLAPSVRKLVEEKYLSPQDILATGRDGRLTKGDVLAHLSQEKPSTAQPQQIENTTPLRREERIPMTRLRKRIAERLKNAQETAAILTTFNEVDMTAVMEVRNQLKEKFEKKHKVKLGFMSFFVKSCVVALKELPAVNAKIEGDDIIYHSYCDIGVAVGTPQGLVVPIIRDADKMSFAQIEDSINEYGQRAREGKLTMNELSGGTFTISNGGVYGSLMSTPILNPPQSAILGMHKIQERPVAINGKIEIRPMMYLALSYDHRIIDGKEAVTFLVRVKECLEAPERILLEM